MHGTRRSGEESEQRRNKLEAQGVKKIKKKKKPKL